MRIAALFPGQGSHGPDMAAGLREHPIVLRGLELLGRDPFAALADGTREQQPAIFLVSVAAWEELEGRDDVVAAAGHSLGEYAALVAAEALAFEDTLLLVDDRARAMADAAASTPGAMVALLGVELEQAAVLAEEHGLVVANDNAPGQVVLSGPPAGVAAVATRVRRSRLLEISGGFHSPGTRSAVEALRRALDAVPVAPARFPVFSNSSVEPFGDVRGELVGNLCSPVRWRETVLALHDLGVDAFVEVGPGEILTGLVRRTLGREVAA